MSKNSIYDTTNKLFKKMNQNDEINFSDNSINFIQSKEEEDKQKQDTKVRIFNSYMQTKNWNGKHMELINEYRQMDNNFPIISAALKIFSQESCITGDCIVSTAQGDKRVDELYATTKNSFLVRAIDRKRNAYVWSECQKVISKGKQKVYEVTVGFEGNKFKCTIDHKIWSKDQFKELGDLKVGDSVGTLFLDIDPTCSCLVPVIKSDTIISIVELGEELVYDLYNVQFTNSFLIKTSQNYYVDVHNCSKDTDGNILVIASDNEKVKNELEDLFFQQLKINSESYLIIKSFLKFGNHYSFLERRPGDGVIGLVHFLPEMIRIDIDKRHIFSLDNFKFEGLGQIAGLKFSPEEIVHFKYVEDLETLPYGQSILRSIVDTYRRVVMMRDALIIYRITRAPQRLLFKLDSGNLGPDEAELHAKEIKKSIAKKPLYNQNTGEFDYKYSPMSIQENIFINSYDGDATDVRVLEGACLVADTKIRTTNGLMTIKELSDYFAGDNKKIYCLSINKHGFENVGKILWCAETKKVKETYKITYNGVEGKEFIVEATDNHPFMIPDLSYVRADELKIGDVLKGTSLFSDSFIVTNIEIINHEEPIPVYDLEVHEFHNFSLEGGIFVHNSNMDAVEDYKIIKDDLFAGLMIPKQYLQFEEVQTAKAALVQEDIRFSNLIKQIQQYYIDGLLQIAIVHLLWKGFSKEEVESFTLTMNTNSTFAERTRKELLEQRFSIAQMAWTPDNEGLNLMSYTQVLKDILKYSDNEIEKIIQDQFIEKKLAWRLINITQNGFYEQTEQDKLEAEEKKKKDQGVFKNLQFESKNYETKNNVLNKLLTDEIDKEIAALIRPVKGKPTKKQVIRLFETAKVRISENEPTLAERIQELKEDLK